MTSNPLTKGGYVAIFVDEKQKLEGEEIKKQVEALLHSKEGARLREFLTYQDVYLPSPSELAPRDKGLHNLKFVPDGDEGYFPEKAAHALFLKNVSEVSPTMRAEASTVSLKKPDRQDANFNAFDTAVSKEAPEIRGKCGVAAFLRAVLNLYPRLGVGKGVDEKDVEAFNEFAAAPIEEEKDMPKHAAAAAAGLACLKTIQAPRPPSQAKLACFDQALADNVLLRMDWENVDNDDCGLLTRRDFKLIADALDKLGAEREDQKPWTETFAGYIRATLKELDGDEAMDLSEETKDEAVNFYLSDTKRDETVLTQLSHNRKRHDRPVPEKDYAFLSFVQSMCRLKHLLQKSRRDPLRTLATMVPGYMRSYLPTYIINFAHGFHTRSASNRRQATFAERTEWMEFDRAAASGPDDPSMFSYELTSRLKTIDTPGGFGYALHANMEILQDAKTSLTSVNLFSSLRCKRTHCPHCLDLLARIADRAHKSREEAAKYVAAMYNVCRRIADLSVKIREGQAILAKTGRLPRDPSCAPLCRFYSSESLLRAEKQLDDDYVLRACAASLLVRLRGMPARNMWCDFWRDMASAYPKERVRYNMHKLVKKHESLVSRLHVSGQIAHMLDPRSPLPDALPVEPQQTAIGVCVYEALQRLQSSIVFLYTVSALNMLCRNAHANTNRTEPENLIAEARAEVKEAAASNPFAAFEDALNDNLSHLKRGITGRDVLVHATRVFERQLRRRIYGHEGEEDAGMESSTSSVSSCSSSATCSKALPAPRLRVHPVAQLAQPASGLPSSKKTTESAQHVRTDVLTLLQKVYADCMHDLCEIWVAPRCVKVDTTENERKKAQLLAGAVSKTFLDCLEALDKTLFEDFDLGKLPSQLEQIDLASAAHPGALDAVRVSMLRRKPLTALVTYLGVCEETDQTVVPSLIKLFYAAFDHNRYLGNCSLSKETSTLVVLLKAGECVALKLVEELMASVQHMQMNTCVPVV